MSSCSQAVPHHAGLVGFATQGKAVQSGDPVPQAWLVGQRQMTTVMSFPKVWLCQTGQPAFLTMEFSKTSPQYPAEEGGTFPGNSVHGVEVQSTVACPATGYPVHGVLVQGIVDGHATCKQATKLEVWKVVKCGHNEGESYGDI